jgi:hypothetical protein
MPLGNCTQECRLKSCCQDGPLSSATTAITADLKPRDFRTAPEAGPIVGPEHAVMPTAGVRRLALPHALLVGDDADQGIGGPYEISERSHSALTAFCQDDLFVRLRPIVMAPGKNDWDVPRSRAHQHYATSRVSSEAGNLGPRASLQPLHAASPQRDVGSRRHGWRIRPPSPLSSVL